MTQVELRTFLSFFNQGGWVFDFNGADFAAFTIDEVGIDLQATYHLSKGKSLEAFAQEYNKKNEMLVLKLFSALLDYYKSQSTYDVNDVQYVKCVNLLDTLNKHANLIDTKITDKTTQEYLNRNNQLIQKAIDEGDYDSAIAKSRTIIEECFCYGIELKGETVTYDGNLSKLRGQFERLYDMVKYENPTEIQKSINNLIGGINKIVDALGDLRNKNSDAHGVGSERIKFKEHHARLIANTARTLCEFLLSVITNKITY